MPDPTATIIIPQRNHAELTLACFSSLRRCEGDETPVLVVDDGSRDNSAEQVRRAELPNCHMIEQPPRGVTAAWNAGMRHVTTRFVVLLNNDVVIRGEFVEALIEILRTRSAAMAGVEWRIERFVPARLRSRLPGGNLLAGWCLAFSVELWNRLGGFDESLKLYWSDTDFQCRAADVVDANQAVLAVVPDLPLRHLGHRTTRRDPDRSRLWQADRERFQKKWFGEARGKRGEASGRNRSWVSLNFDQGDGA